MDERVLKLRRVFRYLKRGVFPPEAVDAFTVGRERELVEIERCLEDVGRGTTHHLFLEGHYGTVSIATSTSTNIRMRVVSFRNGMRDQSISSV
jgi:hypothetical protein